MGKKITTSEFKKYIKEQLYKLHAEYLKEGDIQGLKQGMFMAADSKGNINFGDVQDIAHENGFDVSDEEVTGMMSSIMSYMMKQRAEELVDDINYVVEEYFGGEYPKSFQEFYDIFKTQHFDNVYDDPMEVRKVYQKIITDPNQLSLFEKKIKEDYSEKLSTNCMENPEVCMSRPSEISESKK